MRAMWSMGFRPDRDSALLAFGYGPHVWLWGVHYPLDLMVIPIVTAGGLDSRAQARFVDTYKPSLAAPTTCSTFQIVVSHDPRGMDVLTIVAEPKPEIRQDAYASLAKQIESQIVSRCELRPVVDLLPYGTLSKTEFKAKRVKDVRAQPTT